MLWKLAEILGLSSLVVAEPILGLLRRGSAHLATFRASRTEFAVTGLLVVIAPTLALGTIEVGVASLHQHSTPFEHYIVIALLIQIFVLGLLKHGTQLAPRFAVLASIPLSIGVVVLLFRYPGLLIAFRFMVPLAPLFFLNFLRDDKIIRCSAKPVDAVTYPRWDPKVQRVVVLIFDELPLTSLLNAEGLIDRDLFPEFAALAEQSTWYRNTTTVATGTARAIPAIATGVYPREGSLPVANDHPNNLFNWCEANFHLNVHETLTRLSPIAAQTDRATGWRALTREAFRQSLLYFSPKRHGDSLFGDRQLFQDSQRVGERFLTTLTKHERPSFDWLHILLPHRPWHYNQDGRDYLWLGMPGVSAKVQPPLKPFEMALQRHLLQVQATDRLLGRIVARLRELNEYDDALIVVASDHGCTMDVQTGFRSATEASYPEVLWVPLIIKGPHQTAASIDDRPMLTVDIAPLIADQLGTTLPWPVDGLSNADDGSLRSSVGIVVRTQEPGLDKFAEIGDGPFDRATGFERALATSKSRPCDTSHKTLFGLGSDGQLVGRRLEEFELVATQLHCTYLTSCDLSRVDVRGSRAPWMHGRGSVKGEIIDVDSIAIAVNGVIAGVARLYERSPSEARFEILLNPAEFQSGPNTFTAIALQHHNDTVRFHNVELSIPRPPGRVARLFSHNN